MVEESNILDTGLEGNDTTHGFHDFKLLQTTANASLYLAFKAGKRFLIKTTKDNSERQNKMLRREYELSIGCDHPHLVHIYTIENLPFGTGLVMEYIEGRTLDKYISENPSEKERNRIFSELLSAVGYLHKRGVIHNDIKPENILVTHADNTLKLIDFGLADGDAEYALRALGCTPRYASPELQAQSRAIDARSDIYSIGVLMREIFGKHHHISERCCRANAEARYENISILQRAWQNRNRPQRVMLGVVIAAIFVLPFIFFGQTKLAERNKMIESERLSCQIECDMARMYAIAADSISREIYNEFANYHILAFYDKLVKYQDEHITPIADTELHMMAVRVFVRVSNKYQTCLYEQIESLPMIYKSNLPAEELIFYDSLLNERKPYRPYRAE